MDESLSEFQETKKTFNGPKNIEKQNKKSKKGPKRPRGQKDIRTALRTKKNELEEYSKDFDKVCKKAGIDVNSEQLQLAIALSKSLQDTKTTSTESSEGSKPLTSQDRIGKIRTTLQEYGFKVPEIKIAGNTRKVRKQRKNYKLIQTSDVEKKEIIANRFSQVLFQNITHCSLYCSDIDATEIPLYYLASNVPYDKLKLTDTFYVDNLIEKSVSPGNLLRDWSTIPGRPKSPKLLEPMSVSFSEIECSQDELDIILSGCLKSCKEIVRKKIKYCLDNNECKIINVDDNISIENTKKEEINKTNQEYTVAVRSVNDVEVVEPISTVNNYRSPSPDMFDDEVSDIFDDNIKAVTMQNGILPESFITNTNLEVMDLTEPVCEKSQPELSINNITNRKSNDMELTDCIQIQSKYQCANQTSQLSQKSNVTKRRSNDFMELTECISTSSQPVQHNIDLIESLDIIEENTLKDNTEKDKTMKTKPSESIGIILTSSTVNNDDDIDNRNTPKEVNLNKEVESMDLTQCSNTSDELPFISLTAAREYSSDDTIILDINDYALINKGTNSQTEIVAHIDLTQNMSTDNAAKMQSQSFFEEYNHNHSDSPDNTEENNPSAIANEENHETIDLTQYPFTKSFKNKNTSQESSGNFKGNNTNSPSQLNYCNNSSQSIIEPVPITFYPTNSQSKLNLTLSPNGQLDHNAIDDIDLTQKTDTSEESDQSSKNDHNDSRGQENMEASDDDNDLPPVTISQRFSSLGKKDDVSIDYDELINTYANNKLTFSKNANPEAIIYENSNEDIEKFTKRNSFISNCSQNSEVFEISDKELDYSLHKSKLEMPVDNFAFGSISIMDDLSDFGVSKKSIEADNNYIVNDIEIESFPANNNRKNTKRSNEISPIKHRRITEIATPQKAGSSNTVTVTTPKNSEIIIKTDNVTPMMDYKSMSLSELHEELDKYGVKPFKRKQAIQMLTHIYKETHPIMDIVDDLATPPKRRKLNHPSTSPKKLISPKKLLPSPKKTSNDALNLNENILDTDKENNLSQKYEEGNSYKGKGKGKGKNSLKNKNKDVPEKADDVLENTESRNKKIANEIPICKEIECSPEDWVFQRREKAKVHSCRVPLHIAFFNYVSSRRDLREAILCYEPVEIDLIHKDLVGYGHRYDPKDLLKFLDKKCVTVKTTDNDAKNHRNN